MNRIKELRHEKNLTLQELSDKVGIGRNSINQYENGTRYPKLETWQKLADFFKVSVPYLQGKSSIRTNDIDRLFKQAQIDNSKVAIALNPNKSTKPLMLADNLENALDLKNVKIFDADGRDITNQDLAGNHHKTSSTNNKFPDLTRYQKLLEKVAKKSTNGDITASHILRSIVSLLDIYDY